MGLQPDFMPFADQINPKLMNIIILVRTAHIIPESWVKAKIILILIEDKDPSNVKSQSLNELTNYF